MSCQTALASALSVEELVQRAEECFANHRYYGTSSLTVLLRHLVAAEEALNKDDEACQRITEKRKQLEGRLIDLVQREDDATVRSWRSGLTKPITLRLERQGLIEQANEAPTEALRRVYMTCARSMRELLVEGSERVANTLLQDIEFDLDKAEGMLKESVLSKRDQSRARDYINGAKRNLARIEAPDRHIWNDGMPRVAKKRGVPMQVICAALHQRIDLAENILAVKESMSLEEIRRVEQQAKEEAEVRWAQAEVVRKQQQLEQEIIGLTRRNKSAGQAARDFLEAAARGAEEEARRFYYLIRKYSGGVPVSLQEYHGEFLRSLRSAVLQLN